MRLDKPPAFLHALNSERCTLSTVDTHPSGRFATGGYDGCVRIWKLRRNLRYLKQLQLNQPAQNEIQDLITQLSTVSSNTPLYTEINRKLSVLQRKCETTLAQAGPYYHFDLLSEFNVSQQPISTIRFSPNGHLLAVGTDGTDLSLFRFECYGYTKEVGKIDGLPEDFCNYNTETWTSIWNKSLEFEITGLSWGPDNLSLYACGIKGEVAVLHVNLEPRFYKSSRSVTAPNVPFLLESLDFPTNPVSNTRHVDPYTPAQRANPIPLFPNDQTTTYADEIADIAALDDPSSSAPVPIASFNQVLSIQDQCPEVSPILLSQLNQNQTSWLSNTILNAVKGLILSMEKHDAQSKAYSVYNDGALHPEHGYTPHNPLNHSLFQLPYQDYCLFTQTPIVDIDGVVIDGAKHEFLKIAESQVTSSTNSTTTTATTDTSFTASLLSQILSKIDFDAIVNRYIFNPTTNNTLTTKRPSNYTSNLHSQIPLLTLLARDGAKSDPFSSTDLCSAISPPPTNTSGKFAVQLDDDDGEDDGFGRITTDPLDTEISISTPSAIQFQSQDNLSQSQSTQSQTADGATSSTTTTPIATKKSRRRKAIDLEFEAALADALAPSSTSVVKIGDKSSQFKARRQAYLSACDLGDLSVHEFMELQGYAMTAAEAKVETTVQELTEDLVALPIAFPQTGLSELLNEQFTLQLESLNRSYAGIAQGIACDPFGKFIACVYNKDNVVIFKRREIKATVAVSLTDSSIFVEATKDLEKSNEGVDNDADYEFDTEGGNTSTISKVAGVFEPFVDINSLRFDSTQFPNTPAFGSAALGKQTNTHSLVATERGAYFFRRPDWSADGLFLAVPAGSMPRTTASSKLVDQLADMVTGPSLDQRADRPQTTGPILPTSADNTKDTATITHPHSVPIQEALMVTHVFSRNNFLQPIVSLPSPMNEPTIAVRFNPVPFISTTTAQEFNAILNSRDNLNNFSTNDLTSAIAKSISGTSYYYLLAVAGPTHLTIYRTDTYQPVITHKNVHEQPITDISWFYDGLKLVCTSRDGKCSFVTIQQVLPDHLSLNDFNIATSIMFSPYTNTLTEQLGLLAANDTSSMSMDTQSQQDHLSLVKNKTDVGVVLTGFPKFIYDSHLSALKRISHSALQHNFKQSYKQRPTLLRDGYDALQYILQDVVSEIYKQTFAKQFGYSLSNTTMTDTFRSSSIMDIIDLSAQSEDDKTFATLVNVFSSLLFGSFTCHISGVAKDDTTSHMNSLPTSVGQGQIDKIFGASLKGKAVKRKQPSLSPAIDLTAPSLCPTDAATTTTTTTTTQVNDPTLTQGTPMKGLTSPVKQSTSLILQAASTTTTPQQSVSTATKPKAPTKTPAPSSVAKQQIRDSQQQVNLTQFDYDDVDLLVYSNEDESLTQNNCDLDEALAQPTKKQRTEDSFN